MVEAERSPRTLLAAEVLPLVHFGYAALLIAGALDARGERAEPSAERDALRRAVLGTLGGTISQHFFSLVAHAGRSTSARLSHSIWFLDYTGIALNNVWNAPAMLYLLLPGLASVAWLGNALLGFNLLASAALFYAGARQVLVYQPAPSAGPAAFGVDDGVTIMDALRLGGPLASAAILLLLVLPNALLSIAAGVRLDVRSPLPLVGILTSLAVKENHVPEVWAREGTFDFSPLHSHALWHLGVWASQSIYLALYLEALGLSTHACGEAESSASWTWQAWSTSQLG